eukprot:CAMPEP_0182430706 /NCGR_PEP_ID=MMETSP1167-20130531/42730_1 /TAXON_ID=2988 /ORGANISM="Mallomonas Sp, Strain CCMP3275" /LENGTH=307 /DNA_ID=CAMNT_0024616107 /DNA_START=127 /DNA_END=1050 /DNA_ORIENTATION=+
MNALSQIIFLIVIVIISVSKVFSSEEGQEVCNRYRQFRVTGPLPLTVFPFIADFLQYNLTHRHPDRVDDGRGTCNPHQVPDIAKPHLKRFANCYERSWSVELVDTLVTAAKSRVDFSPRDYPHCVTDFYAAFDKYPITGKKVMIGGAISPWNEAIAIAFGASSVTTAEYSDLKCASDKIKIVSTPSILNLSFKGVFDAICSFSSIEHDGLGRYGDPIDPTGDFSAMKEFKYLLKPGGLLYLGIPIGYNGIIFGNSHRIYNENRLNNLISQTGFELIDTIENHWGKKGRAYMKDFWQNQPIFILKSRE